MSVNITKKLYLCILKWILITTFDSCDRLVKKDKCMLMIQNKEVVHIATYPQNCEIRMLVINQLLVCQLITVPNQEFMYMKQPDLHWGVETVVKGTYCLEFCWFFYLVSQTFACKWKKDLKHWYKVEKHLCMCVK